MKFLPKIEKELSKLGFVCVDHNNDQKQILMSKPKGNHSKIFRRLVFHEYKRPPSRSPQYVYARYGISLVPGMSATKQITVSRFFDELPFEKEGGMSLINSNKDLNDWINSVIDKQESKFISIENDHEKPLIDSNEELINIIDAYIDQLPSKLSHNEILDQLTRGLTQEESDTVKAISQYPKLPMRDSNTAFAVSLALIYANSDRIERRSYLDESPIFDDDLNLKLRILSSMILEEPGWESTWTPSNPMP